MSDTTRVLVVDDDTDSLFLLRLVLCARSEYEAVFCAGPVAALTLDPRSFDVLVTGLHLPGMDGLELAATMRRTDPGLPVLLTTPSGSLEASMHVAHGSVTGVVRKPLRPDAVCDAIDAAAATRRHASRQALALVPSGPEVRRALA